MSALASATTDSSGVSSGGNTMSTSTEAIIAAATSAEAAAAVVQEQGATLVTVHPAVIEAPVDVTEGQGNEGDENEGDGMTNHFICFAVYKTGFLVTVVLWSKFVSLKTIQSRNNYVSDQEKKPNRYAAEPYSLKTAFN